jgi:hypothetical protein
MRVAGRRICAPLLLAVSVSQGQPPSPEMSAVSRADLCVTEGALEERHGPLLAVTASKMRAYVNRPSADAAELSFTYLGSTDVEARLGSGASRRQLGIKLRAANACNLIYVMWRIEPESKLVVSVKANPGQHSSAECANRGYHNLKPTVSSAIPHLQPGQAHRLLALIRSQELSAYVDGARVWHGSLSVDAADFTGPVGVRTDNARVEFALSTEAQAAGIAHPAPRCRSGPDESE